MNHVADRLPKGPRSVLTTAYLGDLPPDPPLLREATADDVRAWLAGTEPIPTWVARVLLHDVADDILNTTEQQLDEDDELDDELDEDEPPME